RFFTHPSFQLPSSHPPSSVKFPSFSRRHVTGAFQRMKHDHLFEEQAGATIMRDRFEFQAPFGPLGRLVDALILTGYMRRFIMKRNAVMKQTAEGEAWKRYLEAPNQTHQHNAGDRSPAEDSLPSSPTPRG
ncbi:MAG TPA: hypothetical protein VHF69_06260, partial [Candidatus Synoicihabitans sp.]|nr:hypothetical protein [Candidatus Synoicihabitans sp.]